jgi:hypothetical protein
MCVTTLATLSAIVFWRGSLMVEATDQAESARDRLQMARSAAAEIERLSKLPATALAPGIRDSDLLREIQEALASGGIQTASVRDLALDARTEDRGGGGGVGGGGGAGTAGLQRRSGRLVLEATTLPQLGQALAALRERLPPLQIDQLNLQRTAVQDDTPSYRVTVGFVAFAPLPLFQRPPAPSASK